mmetsp:Transcript_4479/g.17622  ORF Transcript_4479/g.17622 Transcript_4479/m.17622 type:complete len:588 (+) Transcript_4479:3483-5246(+)
MIACGLRCWRKRSRAKYRQRWASRGHSSTPETHRVGKRSLGDLVSFRAMLPNPIKRQMLLQPCHKTQPSPTGANSAKMRSLVQALGAFDPQPPVLAIRLHRLPMLPSNALLELQNHLVDFHRVADAHGNGSDFRLLRGMQRGLHFHRLHDCHALAFLDFVARSNVNGDDLAGHWGLQDLRHVHFFLFEQVLVVLVLRRGEDAGCNILPVDAEQSIQVVLSIVARDRLELDRIHLLSSRLVKNRDLPRRCVGQILLRPFRIGSFDLSQGVLVDDHSALEHRARPPGDIAKLQTTGGCLVINRRKILSKLTAGRNGHVHATGHGGGVHDAHIDGMAFEAIQAYDELVLQVLHVVVPGIFRQGNDLAHFVQVSCDAGHDVVLEQRELGLLVAVRVLLANELGRGVAALEGVVLENAHEEANVVPQTADRIVGERPVHVLDGIIAGVAIRDELGDHGIIMHRDLRAFEDAGVHTGVVGGLVQRDGLSRLGGDQEIFGLPVGVQRARRRKEAAQGILRVDAALDCMSHGIEESVGGEKRIRKGPSGSDVDHVLHQVLARDGLGHGVLHLQARVHLQEVEILLLVAQELNGAG